MEMDDIANQKKYYNNASGANAPAFKFKTPWTSSAIRLLGYLFFFLGITSSVIGVMTEPSTIALLAGSATVLVVILVSAFAIGFADLIRATSFLAQKEGMR